ncbi:hypothetical protein [Mycobacterium sp.]|uniref:hypothetical protein n=1 Tax=Mycobacterium sp. TaxID=1785 RepID=UPI00127B09BB|nr:hypothetical protein [Mycobacterium sp.]KAA8969139.1 MAG: hypothetical protein F6Q13_04075 [Mycobacterium sp.]
MLLLAGAGIIPVTLGLPPAAADPSEQELDRLANRYASTTCAQLAQIPGQQGVYAAIADVMDRSAIARSAAERVVLLASQASCPQYQSTVKEFVSPAALEPAD